MKFVALVFWWAHRRCLKSRGYSLGAFCLAADQCWRKLVADTDVDTRSPKTYAIGITDAFSRRELRARW